MIKELDLILSPKEAAIEELYTEIAATRLKIKLEDISAVKVLRRSIDARSRSVKVNLRLLVVFGETAPQFESPTFNYQDITNKDAVIVVGAGPAGLFAALRLIELGYKPIVLERGKDVSSRKIDLAKINREHIVDPDSNYAFGEGGAGTFSDGKLYTRSKKRGSIRKILEVFHFHGASDDILVDAHPHIGTDKLPKVIKNIRESILNAGGEVHFNTRVVDLMIDEEQVKGVKTLNGDEFKGKAVILATGHSARDMYELLHEKEVKLEAKSFAMGVRIEHPQSLIDSIQYHSKKENPYLPSASYSLVHQVEGRGVYSFCMCPGGFIVPASTAPNEMVVNGMSPSKRNSPYANSGVVVEIREEDLDEFKEHGVLAGLRCQQNFERLAYNNGGEGLTAPAQRMHDFVKGKLSSSLPDTSYIPGVLSSPMHQWMPKHIRMRLQEGLKQFGKKMQGYLTNEAIILGVESRTSSPVRIPRDRETFQHVEIKGLFPCGEGAGYAGGIASSAVDGERVAEMVDAMLDKS